MDVTSSTSTGEDRSANVDDRRSPEPGRQLTLTTRPRHRSASPRDGTNDLGGPGCPVRGRRLAAGEMQAVSIITHVSLLDFA